MQLREPRSIDGRRAPGPRGARAAPAASQCACYGSSLATSGRPEASEQAAQRCWHQPLHEPETDRRSDVDLARSRGAELQWAHLPPPITRPEAGGIMLCNLALLSLAAQLASVSASKECAITDHGADASAANNTAAIQKAIAACAAGGTVIVTGGDFKTGPLVVSGGTNLALQVEAGASLVAAFGPDDWPVTSSASLAASLRSPEHGIRPGCPCRTKGCCPATSGHYQDFIVFDNCEGCSLRGKGTIFGKGGRPPSGFDWYYLFDQHKLKHSRPMFVTVNACKNFTMAGVKLLDAPEFNVALNGVTGAEIHDVNITSTWYVDPKSKKLMEPHNTDAIDPGGGSSNIHIHDVWVHNGDDSVAVKPSKLGDCTRDILVENSHFEFGHGCSIGSVGSGCVENVLFRNITMRKQECGCRVKTYSESEGHVHNITWREITVDDTDDCVTVNANYKPLPKDPKHFIDVSGLTFTDIVGTNCGNPPEFVCPEQAPCKRITLDNVKLSGKGDFKMNCLNAQGTAADGVVPKSCLGPD